MGVASERCVCRGRASREDLCAELGSGIVTYEDTGLVLWMILATIVGCEVFESTYAIVVLTGSASRLGVELARAASGHLVGDSLDVVVGGVGGGHFDVWCLS